MKHLEFLQANGIKNTSTSVYEWIDKMPANQAEKAWLKSTFDALYQIEQRYVVDHTINNDKETTKIASTVSASSQAWVNKIIELHHAAEPGEQLDELVIPEANPLPTPAKKQETKEVPAATNNSTTLEQQLMEHLDGASSKNISKDKLAQMGYQGPYPSGSKNISIEGLFTIKRKSRAVTNQFVLSKD